MRVLIVDDDMGMSQMLQSCFSRWDWASDASHTAAGALDAFRQGRYDLAVCDVDLPDGNGIALARVFSAAKPGTRVVMVSGNPDNLKKARDSGLSACLRKPFDLDDLKNLLDPQEIR
ncbi:MAG: response regulator [Elusimicrobia bacterium]|nr:response regulator [Elusimicrobiota bacterium]